MYVGDRLTLGNGAGNGSIGTSTRSVRSAQIVNGCFINTTQQTCGFAASKVFRSSSVAPNAPISMPTIDIQSKYNLANWSMTGSHPVTCTGTNPFAPNSPFETGSGANSSTRTNSLGNVDLLGMGPFNCTAVDSSGHFVGSLAWTGPTSSRTGTLTINGTVFIDGNLTIAHRLALVAGTGGTIYVNGKITLTSDGHICGAGTPGLTSRDPSDCSIGAWDPAQPGMSLVACNASSTTNSACGSAGGTALSMTGNGIYEVGFFAIGQADFGNSSQPRGPVVASNGTVSGAVQLQQFVNLPAGSPYTPAFGLGNVANIR